MMTPNLPRIPEWRKINAEKPCGAVIFRNSAVQKNEKFSNTVIFYYKRNKQVCQLKKGT